MAARPAAAGPVMARGSVAPVMHAQVARMSAAAPGRVLVVRRSSTATVTRMRTAHGMVRVVRRASPNSVRPVRQNFNNVNNDANLEFDDFPVPGLGFDEVHFAATHPNAFNHRHSSSVGGFFPFFSGGFLFPSVPTVVEDEAPAETEEVAEDTPRKTRVIVVPQPQQPVVASASPEEATAPASDQYVFVRRDGTVFFAVAYSWENGGLRYITAQGLRGTLTRDALDLNATQQFNEQRGLSFRLPA